MKLTKGEWFVVLFNLAYLVPFGLYYLFRKDYEFIVYVAVLALIALVVLFTLRKSKLDYFALWGLSIWGLVHMLGGGLMINGSTLYAFRIFPFFDGGGEFFILKMDQLIHFYGFGVAAVVVYQILINNVQGVSKRLAVFLAWIGAMGFGALNEVVEFGAFVFLARTGVGGVYNTGLDLVFNTFGALAGAFLANKLHKRKKRKS